MPQAEFAEAPLRAPRMGPRPARPIGLAALANRWIEQIAPTPWQASTGAVAHLRPAMEPPSPFAARKAPAPLYTPEERARRDASVWTLVQAILAPLQFLVFLISASLIVHWAWTGSGYEWASASIVVKTLTLYAIMITGSIWEKVVFGKWLFARAFFWEDVFSMLVLALHSAYLVAITFHIGNARGQILLAVAAYATYVINAGQFLWKLRVARLEAQTPPRPLAEKGARA